jgi:hypothetical protein
VNHVGAAIETRAAGVAGAADHGDPDAAALARIVSMLCTSASVVWSSQYAQLFEITLTPSPIIALSIVWKLPRPANGPS